MCSSDLASEAIGDIQDGTMLAIALAAEERLDAISDVATFREYGLELVDGAFRGYACPKDVPDDVYDYLVESFAEVITSEAFVEAMDQANIPYMYKSAADFQTYADERSTELKAIEAELKAN